MGQAQGWGIIGLGDITFRAIVPTLMDESQCRIVAAVSRSQERVAEFARRFDVPHALTAFKDLLAVPEVDVVYIATPNASHADQVIAAAGAAKHVLCEKPLATSLDDALNAVRACERAGVALGVNFHNRHASWVADLAVLLRAGEIGDVLTVSVDVGVGAVEPSGWRADPALSGLGTTYSHGIHVYDFLRFVLDADPIEVFAMFDDGARSSLVETTSLVQMRFDDGILVSASSDQRVPFPTNDIVIHGSRGRIVGRGLTREPFSGELCIQTDRGTRTKQYTHSRTDVHRLAVRSFVAAVREGTEPAASGRDGLHSMLLTDAIEKSVARRASVTLSYGRIHPFDGRTRSAASD